MRKTKTMRLCFRVCMCIKKVGFLRKRIIFSITVTISGSIFGKFILFLAIYVRLQQIVDVMSGRSSILIDRFIT